MIRRANLLVCVVSLSLPGCAPSTTDGGTDTTPQTEDGAPYPMLEPRSDMRVEQAVRVPMRDGVRLAGNAVHHSPEYPSPVPLPIVPEGASRLLELN